MIALERILLQVLTDLGGESYGVPIHQSVERAKGGLVSYSAMYAAFDRLERKGCVSSRPGEATPERGDRPKKYFKIEEPGIVALNEAGKL